jgi:hypothetical protein
MVIVDDAGAIAFVNVEAAKKPLTSKPATCSANPLEADELSSHGVGSGHAGGSSDRQLAMLRLADSCEGVADGALRDVALRSAALALRFSGEIRERHDADESSVVGDHGQAAQARGAHELFDHRQLVVGAAALHLLGHRRRDPQFLERLAFEQRTHADVAVGDHADDDGRTVTADDRQATTIVLPHQMSRSSERIVGPAAVHGPRHDLVYTHRYLRLVCQWQDC